jgi:acetyltransferase-like isoleucine patch superfamily enzyme
VSILFKLAEYQKAGTNVPLMLLGSLYYRLRGLKIRAHHRVRIKGLQNIKTRDVLDIGLGYVGFSDPRDKTWINVQGSMLVEEYFNMGRGCRIDVGPKGKLVLRGSRITANTTIIAMNSITIGRGCAISWGVEIIDSDFHELSYEGRVEKDPAIIIGDRVWIGGHAKILKGVTIGNGCVIAANSVVTKSFEGENLLVGGAPARILKEDVRWN